jgi:hypothetical protein
MLNYATSQIGIAETKRKFFVISAKRSYAKATDFERKVVAWKVAYSLLGSPFCHCNKSDTPCGVSGSVEKVKK